MKETIGAADLANEFIIKVENKWVTDQMDHVEKMRYRAEKSNTLIAHHEYESAQEMLTNEIARLIPSKKIANGKNAPDSNTGSRD